MQARHHIRGVPDDDEATSVARQTAIPDPRSGDERRRSTEEATGSVTPGRLSPHTIKSGRVEAADEARFVVSAALASIAGCIG